MDPRLNYVDIVAHIQDLCEGEYELLSTYSAYTDKYQRLEPYNRTNKDKLRIKHTICGGVYDVRPNEFQQWYRCPLCSKSQSREEEDFVQFIKDIIGEPTKRNYRLDGKELNVYVPARKLGFEFTDFYWHSDKFRDKNFHLQKLHHFQDRGIRVYFIDSWDWRHKNGIIKDQIKSILGLNKTIYARKTTVKLVPLVEEKAFLQNNHIQGYTSSSFTMGLYYEDTLVSLLSFVKSKKNLNQQVDSLELLRSCSALDIDVVGGFSKLLKASETYIQENLPDVSVLTTVADLMLSDGEIYTKCGFTLHHTSKPSYYYIYKNQKYNRYRFRKSSLLKTFPEVAKPELTEFKITDKLHAYRIWNCGNLVFTKDLSAK